MIVELSALQRIKVLILRHVVYMGESALEQHQIVPDRASSDTIAYTRS